MSVRNTITRNTAFNAGGRLWEAAVTLVLTPYIVERIGMAPWGLWALLSVFTGYVALSDFGIGSGFAKFVAEHAARDEKRDLSAVVSTGLLFYAVLGVIIVAVGWPCIEIAFNLLDKLDPATARDFTKPAFLADARFLLRWGLVLFAVSGCVSPFTAVQTGLQRMDITNLVAFGASLIKVGATLYFIGNGYGVRGLLYVNAMVLAVFAVASVVLAHTLAPGLRVSATNVRRRTFGRLYHFGWRAQVARLSNLVMFQTDVVIVAVLYKFLGMVGLYDLGVSLANKMRQVPALLVSALMPAASDLDARREDARLQQLYLVSSKYLAAVTAPIVLFTVGAAGPLMRTWLGAKRDLDIAAWVLRIIAAGYMANILPGAGVSIALGKGRSDVQMKAGLIAMASNIALTLALAPALGFYGIPIATAAAMFIAWAWFSAAMSRVIGVGPGRLFRTSVLWPAAAALPGFAVCVCADVFTANVVGRRPNAVVVAGCAIAFSALYLGIIRITPFLDAFDMDFLERTLKLGRVPGFRLLMGRPRPSEKISE